MHLLLVVHYCIERVKSFPKEIALKEVGWKKSISALFWSFFALFSLQSVSKTQAEVLQYQAGVCI